MIEVQISNDNLLKFYNCLRKADLDEMEFFIGKNSVNQFIDLCFSSTRTYLLRTKSGNPLVLGGLKEVIYQGQLIGQVWLLSSEFLFERKKSVYKYVLNKISEFKSDYNFLFNYIYKTNFSALFWLKKCGFHYVDLKVKDFKFFYFKKGDYTFDLRDFTG